VGKEAKKQKNSNPKTVACAMLLRGGTAHRWNSDHTALIPKYVRLYKTLMIILAWTVLPLLHYLLLVIGIADKMESHSTNISFYNIAIPVLITNQVKAF